MGNTLHHGEIMSNAYILVEKFIHPDSASLQRVIPYEDAIVDGINIRSKDGSERISYTHQMTLCVELDGELYRWKTLYRAVGL